MPKLIPNTTVTLADGRKVMVVQTYSGLLGKRFAGRIEGKDYSTTNYQFDLLPVEGVK